MGVKLLCISGMAAGTEHVTASEFFVNDAGVVALVDIRMTPPGDEPWHGEDAWLLRTDGTQITHLGEHWFDTRGFDDLTAWQRPE